MSDKTDTVQCGEALTIANAASIVDQVKSILGETANINVDAHEVDKVDTAGLQIFIALNREVEKSHGKLTWQSPSEALESAARTLGLSKAIGLSV